MSVLTGISIGINCFGKGLYIPHYGSIIVNSTARFGDNCIIQSGTNISEGVVAGHDVYVAAGAVILKNVKIADGVIIAANAVLRDNITDDNAVVAGIPAKVISYNGMLTGRTEI